MIDDIINSFMQKVQKDGLDLKTVINEYDNYAKSKKIWHLHIHTMICLEAVRQNGLALKFVDYGINNDYNLYSVICMEAVRQNPEAMQFVQKNISDNNYLIAQVAAYSRNSAI